MIIPGVLAQQAMLAVGGGGGVWTPLDLPNVPQIYLHATISTVTDVSGACSAISNIGAMGSGGAFQQSTPTRRPAIINDAINGNRALRFDGVDDLLLGGTDAQRLLLANVGAGWYFAVVKKLALDSPSTTNRIFVNVPKSTTGTARFRVSLTTGAAGTENRASLQATPLDGGATSNMSAAASQGTTYSMQLVHMNYATGAAAIYVDGSVSVANSSFTAPGNTSNTASIIGISIGATATPSLFTDAELATIILDNTALSSSDIDRIFGWAAHEFGLTSNLPTDHPYKYDAPTT